VLRTEEGRVLTRSEAVFHMMRRLGGGWRLGAALGGIFPRALRDGVYDVIARIRHRLFAKPEEACPLVPADLRARFLP